MSVYDMKDHAIELLEEGFINEFSILGEGVLTVGPFMHLKLLDTILTWIH